MPIELVLRPDQVTVSTDEDGNNYFAPKYSRALAYTPNRISLQLKPYPHYWPSDPDHDPPLPGYNPFVPEEGWEMCKVAIIEDKVVVVEGEPNEHDLRSIRIMQNFINRSIKYGEQFKEELKEFKDERTF